jgi:hypothetical protein
MGYLPSELGAYPPSNPNARHPCEPKSSRRYLSRTCKWFEGAIALRPKGPKLAIAFWRPSLCSWRVSMLFDYALGRADRARPGLGFALTPPAFNKYRLGCC